MQRSDLFDTAFIIDEVSDAAPLCAELRAAILARRAANPSGLQISNRLGWHSEVAMLSWGGGAAMRLVEHVIGLADRFTRDVKAVEGMPRYAWVPEMWANVSGRGASNQYHVHPGAFWAAIFYVEDGYNGSSDRRLGGELEIEDPRMPMLQMENPDLRLGVAVGQAPPPPEIVVRPAAGKLLMFPGWLRHGVRPYLGTGQRISIAINLTAMRVG